MLLVVIVVNGDIGGCGCDKEEVQSGTYQHGTMVQARIVHVEAAVELQAVHKGCCFPFVLAR